MTKFNVGEPGRVREPDKKTILIIEDEDPYRWALSENLKAQDFNVVEAKNGEDGLELAFDLHPDLILLDLILPKIDGIGLLKRLRENGWGKSASVIILTGLSDQLLINEAAELGVDDFLIKKDWTLDAIINKIKQNILKKIGPQP